MHHRLHLNYSLQLGKCIKPNMHSSRNNLKYTSGRSRIYYGSAPVHTLCMSPLLCGVCVCVCTFVGLFELERETERVRGCVCFHLLHNREWRQSVLPCLAYYSVSSVGARGHSLIPRAGTVFGVHTQNTTLEPDTGRVTVEVRRSCVCRVGGV